MNLSTLLAIIRDRQKSKPPGSYTASLFRDGNNRIAQKVGEEAIEVVLAAKNKSKKRITEELADLFFHTLVLMRSKNITLKDIYKELDKRNVKNKSV